MEDLIKIEELTQTVGRNKLFNGKMMALITPGGEGFNNIVEEVKKTLLTKQCKGGEIINKTMTWRFYPVTKTEENEKKIRIMAMAMIRPAK